MRGRIGSLLEVGTGFHPELTGRENIFLNGAILGMRRAEIARQFDEIVAFAEVGKFIDTAVKHYSSGMYLRLAFAVAAHLETEILFVDEVLAVGDAAFQKKCLGKMGDVARQGRTVIFVSHNMTALRALCTRAVWLNEGKTMEDGPAETVVNHYLQKNAAPNLESRWDDPETAPGDHRARLHLARVNVKNEETDQITVDTPFEIEFQYWNFVPDAVLNVSMFLYTLEEVCVFRRCLGRRRLQQSAGLIRQAVRIPGGPPEHGVLLRNSCWCKTGPSRFSAGTTWWPSRWRRERAPGPGSERGRAPSGRGSHGAAKPCRHARKIKSGDSMRLRPPRTSSKQAGIKVKQRRWVGNDSPEVRVRRVAQVDMLICDNHRRHFQHG